ncbi:predicted outer membrane protein [Psychromonas ingrahamii 37]|uniref:Predicted outer membrane protein n=1 Tax=Psychromonas ingrahamii (strain DSM 17664 / CCUG 51855 / 37) TaxID=357804 RepID=A1SRL8_PSYIN|nr:DUF2608 domain-containing protein [Psychromonas ingrahamii]ABM02133.1 predicted outer membrane protein [Psychromonas ingrahamii 37]
MKHIKLITAFSLSLFTLIANANVSIIETDSFNQVSNTVAKKAQQYGVKNTLIVFDIDNTLLTSNVDLGGDIWYQWQTGKLEIKPTKAQIVPCLFEDAIGLLYKLGTMVPTEAQVPSLISQWQLNGHNVIALTARPPNVRPPTERALTRRSINFSGSAVAPIGEKSPVYRAMVTIDNQTREVSYMSGIMMTTGLHKGDSLKYLLNLTERHFDAIVFVDDSENNITDMSQSFKSESDVDLTAIHYTYIEEQRKKKFGAVLTQQQANTMASQWNDLKLKLDTLFPGRKNGGKCLNQ